MPDNYSCCPDNIDHTKRSCFNRLYALVLRRTPRGQMFFFVFFNVLQTVRNYDGPKCLRLFFGIFPILTKPPIKFAAFMLSFRAIHFRSLKSPISKFSGTVRLFSKIVFQLFGSFLLFSIGEFLNAGCSVCVFSAFLFLWDFSGKRPEHIQKNLLISSFSGGADFRRSRLVNFCF